MALQLYFYIDQTSLWFLVSWLKNWLKRCRQPHHYTCLSATGPSHRREGQRVHFSKWENLQNKNLDDKCVWKTQASLHKIIPLFAAWFCSKSDEDWMLNLNPSPTLSRKVKTINPTQGFFNLLWKIQNILRK